MVLLQDFRYGFRQLRRAPGFASAAILTLALGVGASTAIFSVVHGLLLESLPFRDAGRIFGILETHPQINGGTEATYPDYLDWRAQQKSFEQIAAYSTVSPATVSLTANGESDQVSRVLASGDFFSLLGTAPQLGRLIGKQDDVPGSDHVAVLSAEAWQRYFGRDPGIVGRAVGINGTRYTIIGVLPFHAGFPADGEVWLPLSLLDQPTQVSRVWHSVRVLGRLRRDVDVAAARVEMQTVAARIAQAYPATNRLIGIQIKPLRDELVGAVRPAILAASASVALLLLIACTNVASLLRVRAIGSRREIGIRQALGASRMRILSQSLAHAVILCLAGGLSGAALAFAALPLLRLGLAHTAGIDPSAAESIKINLPVLLFTLAACALTALVFGLVSAGGSRSKPGEFLRPGDRGSTNNRSLSRAVLIACEIAVAVVVLFLSTLVLHSFQRLLAVDPGFRTDHLLSFEITLPAPGYEDDSPVTNHFFEQLMDRVAKSPGVVSVGTTTQIPLNPSEVMTRFLVEGAPPLAPGTYPMAQLRFVSPDLFRTMGVALHAGSFFNRDAVENSSSGFIVNEAFVKQYLTGRNPLSARIIIGVLSPQPEKIPVTGVIADSHDLGVDAEPQPEIYLAGYGLHEVVLVRTALEPQSALSAVRSAVHSLDPTQPIYHAQTIEEVLSNSIARQRATSAILCLFALMAVILAAVGIYGVLSYTVNQRTREIGIRMAVGAQRRDVAMMFIRQAAAAAGAGIVAGLWVGVGCAHLFDSLFFKTSVIDPLSICLTVALPAIIAAIAVTLPVHRAASVDPIETLRAE